MIEYTHCSLLQVRLAEAFAKSIVARAFSPLLPVLSLPGASPQADIDRALGAFQLVISLKLKRRGKAKRRRRDAIPAWGEAPGSNRNMQRRAESPHYSKFCNSLGGCPLHS